MEILSTLKKHQRTSFKRLGRGRGSKKGKTCGRGQKGMGARSGVRRRHGYEGGQMPLHMKVPNRGFSRARFQKRLDTVNLDRIQRYFEDGDLVSGETLYSRGLISGKGYGLKVLGQGTLTKKVTIEADAFSDTARQKLDQAQISYQQL